MVRSPKRGSFEASLRTVEVSTEDLYRLSTRPLSEPYFADQGRNRFDDPAGMNGVASFGVLYAGHTPMVAFAESVAHENSMFNARSGCFEVSSATLHGRSLVTFVHPRRPHLKMVDLTGEALKALGLNNDLCAGNKYRVPQRWSAAIHGAMSDADGLRFTSRQTNSSFCYAVFDRSGLEKDDEAELPDDVLKKLCATFNVREV